jgi:hypothetical protein
MYQPCQRNPIPASVTSIGALAFYGCSSLANITIPANVASIGYQAFYQNPNLTSVTFAGTMDNDSFSSNSPFDGDLHAKFYATDSTDGTPGTYLRSGSGTYADPFVWTKQ